MKGRVLSTAAGLAEIEVLRPPECEECGGCPESGKSTLSLSGSEPLNPGDTVLLSVRCGVLTGIAAILYLMPAVAALAGFIAGYSFQGNPGGLAGALIALAACYALIKAVISGKNINPVRIIRREED